MAERIYRVLVSPKSERLLTEYVAFLAAVSKPAAQRLRAGFQENAASLRHFPERYHYLHDELLPKSKYRKLLFEKTFLILYEVVGDTVFIEYVVDCREEYAWLLK